MILGLLIVGTSLMGASVAAGKLFGKNPHSETGSSLTDITVILGISMTLTATLFGAVYLAKK